jgi:hypothetical protein
MDVKLDAMKKSMEDSQERLFLYLKKTNGDK